MPQSILDLEPKVFWKHFNDICKIPHESGNEAGLREKIIEFAGSLGLEHVVDAKGNLVVKKSASNSSSDKAVAIQGHLDMVCEKAPGSKHDFAKDPITPVVDGEWLRADGTSLGADDGVMIAASMAVMESKDLTHGPLEFIFTVEEETGLYGAFDFDASQLKAKTLINLDSEDDGMLFVGCAGGADSKLNFQFKKADLPSGYSGLSLEVSGLLGGHSGLCIHLGRGNAIKIAGRVLADILQKKEVLLSDIKGGTRHNVIPSETTVNFAVKSEDADAVRSIVEKVSEGIRDELGSTDPDCKIEIGTAKVDKIIDKDTSSKVINFIHSVPNGVIKMSSAIEGLVQTSSTLAVVKTEEDNFFLHVSSRSSAADDLISVRKDIASMAEKFGAKIDQPEGYPGWQPDMSSKLLEFTKKVFADLFGKEPKVTAMHAGLECGLIGEKVGGMDMISFGPTLKDVHSINERLEIHTAQNMWNLLTKILEELSKH